MVVIDVRLPGIDGIEAIGRLADVAPAVTAIVYSAYGDRRLLSDAMARARAATCSRARPSADLLRAVRTVAAGDAYVDPSLSPT